MNLAYSRVLFENKLSIGLINFCVYYVRYVNKIMFGIQGLKSLASFVKKECDFFILNNLHINVHISNLYNSKTCKVKYLGFVVKSLSGTIFKNKRSFNEVRQQNKVFLNEPRCHYYANVQSKIWLRVSEIAGYLVKKVLLNQMTDRVSHETFIVKIVENIFSRY